MDFISELWLPILLSAVGVFIASSLVHMVLQWHNIDCAKMANESAVLESMRNHGVQPGMYVFPHADSMKACGTPEMIEKYNQGPVGFVTVLPNGPFNIGRSLGLWFLYCIMLSVFVAYVADLALQPGRDYMDVFRLTGTVAFMGYGLGIICDTIWKGASWSYTFKFIVDGLFYALVTAGVFGWLWPEISLGM